MLTIALRGEQGEVTGYLGVHRDITERKRAEDQLRESSRRIEDILQSITDAYYALDREWHFTYINERALHYLEEVKGDDRHAKTYWRGTSGKRFPRRWARCSTRSTTKPCASRSSWSSKRLLPME